MERFITLCLVLLLSLSVAAQWRGLRLSTLGPEQGLTMRVNSIVQDSIGYLYFAGNQGLVRYDGVDFKHFVNIYDDTTSIGAGEVYQAQIGSDGFIWLTLRFSGLNRFDPRTNSFKRYSLPHIPEKTELGCDAVMEDEKGDIWVGGQRLRLYRVDRQQDTLEMFYPEWLDLEALGGRLGIVKILQDNQNPDIFWLSITDYTDPHPNSEKYGYGFFSFDRKTGEFVSFPSIGRISHQDKKGVIYSTNFPNRYVSFDPASSKATSFDFRTSDFPKKYMSRDMLEQDGDVWLLTAYEILKIDAEGNQSTMFTSQKDDPNLNKFFKDRSGHLWITSEQGVRVFDQNANRIQFYSLSEFDDNQRIYPGRLAYDEDANSILLAHSAGIANKRLYRIPLDTKQKADYIQTEHATWGITSDDKNRIWSSGGGKLYQLSDTQMTMVSEPGSQIEDIPWHWNMRSNDSGMIGIIPTDRFMWFDSDSVIMHTVMLKDFPKGDSQSELSQQLKGFTFGNKDDAILFSSAIYHVDLGSDKVTRLKYDSSLNPNSDEIFDVRIDQNDFYWISGPNYTGKFELENDSLILKRAYTVQNGLAESAITEMHIDYQNRIWCFTGSGLNCIDEKSGELRYFGVREGLQQIFNDPRQVISLPDHRIVSVNKNGFIIFHPDSLWNVYSPRSVDVVINNIRLNGDDVITDAAPNYLSSYTIEPGKNVVDIQFQGLSYPTATQLNYSYRLLGFQDDWIDIGTNNSVTLSGLSSGNYTFQVKAGAISSNAPVKELNIHIPVPFFRKWWVVLLMLLLLGTALYFIYQYRIAKVKEEEEEKTKVNKKIAELEMQSLRSQMNPHFMFNSLNSIKNFILRSEPKQAAEYLSNFAHLIRMILQNSREKTISLQEELESLMLYIELEQLRFDEEFKFNCEIGEGVQMEQIFIPPMILQPYIENAIWHGLMHKKGRGLLSLIFQKCGNDICCIIEDNGVGRRKAMELKNKSIRKYKSMGMGITRDRIELGNKMDSLGISVEIIDLSEAKDGQTGTKVIVKIPQNYSNAIQDS